MAPSWGCEAGGSILEIEIPAELTELLLIRAAEQEVSVEEIVERAIQNFMKRGENHAE